MSSSNNVHPSVYELMLAVRKQTRTTLIHQHLIAGAMGLHVTDAECIDFLQEMGPSTAGDLARATRLTTGAITSVIDRLERAGYVQRSPDPNDRRKVIVSFIPQKHGPTKAKYGALAAAVQQLFETYSPEQLQFLIQHTQALTDIYKAQTELLEKSK